MLAFVCFWNGRIKALRKKLLEHFTAIFGILHDLSVWKIEDSGKFRKKSEESGLSTQIGMGIHIFALLSGSYIQKKENTQNYIQENHTHLSCRRKFYKEVKWDQVILFSWKIVVCYCHVNKSLLICKESAKSLQSLAHFTKIACKILKQRLTSLSSILCSLLSHEIKK